MPKNIETLRELIIHQLRELLTMEDQMVRLVPKMMELAENRDLRGFLRECQKESKSHVGRLEDALKTLDHSASTVRCEAIVGLIATADKLLIKTSTKGVRDAALAAIVQKLKYHQIAGYSTAHAQARALGYDKLGRLFQRTLEEELESNKRLVKLATRKLHYRALSREREASSFVSRGGL